MSRYYIFELPADLTNNLEAFKLDFEEPSHDTDLSDSANSSDEDSSDEESEDIVETVKPSNLAVTQYSDTSHDEQSMEEWQWENRAHITGSPFVYFSKKKGNSELISGTIADDSHKVLAIYKSWFDLESLVSQPVLALSQLPSQGKSCVLMVSSGNFAGLIVDHKRLRHKVNVSNPAANVMVIESKTFHRYTTRRKQGGSQSASDAAKGKANSAGSTIRRANEKALQNEIRELLKSWAGHLKDCHRIFFKAPGRSNRQLLYGYPDAPILASDKRLAQIPFATAKPTLLECKNSWLQLTQASWVDPPKPPPKPPVKAQSPSRASTPNTSSKQTKKSPEPISADEQITNRIIEVIKRSKIPALKQIFEEELKMQLDFKLQPDSNFVAFPTALLYAAHLDKANIVTQLIIWGANPLDKNQLGQTIGELVAGHPKTKQALQTLRHDLGESQWAWDKAKIGPPMSKKDLLSREVAEKLKLRKEQEAAEQEHDREEHNKRMERLINKHGSGKLVGGLYEASRGLSEEDLKQVERERRARAAEARLKRLS